MPAVDPRVYVDGIEDSNVHDAMHRALGAIHDRLLLLERNTGSLPNTQVDAPTAPPPAQNPPPLSPANINVQFNPATGFYTVTITAPWNIPAQSGSELSQNRGVPVGTTATYHLISSLDPNFGTIFADYGIGQQHVFTVFGPAGLFFRAQTSIDGGQTFGQTSPSRNINSQ